MRRRDVLSLLAAAPVTLYTGAGAAQPAAPRGSRARLAALDPTGFAQCSLDEGGRAGTFAPLPLARLSASQRAEFAADQAQGLYFASTANPDFVLARVQTRVLRPEMFGAVGDGRTNDDDAFQSMAAVARARGTLDMAGTRGKTYAYTQPFWLAGIRRIDIDGRGCGFRNILGTDAPERYDTVNYAGLALPCATNTYAHNSRSSHTVLGGLIESAAAGARTLVTRGAAPAVKSGDRVLIYGFDRQVSASDPCCARYFEYRTAVAVTGRVVSLKTPLRYSYDAGWYDGVHGANAGAPRILALDRADFSQIARLRLANFTIEPNLAWTTRLATPERNGRLQVYGYDEAILENISCPAIYIGQGRRFRAERCSFTGQTEVDKLIERVHFKSCALGEIGGWTSVLNSVLEDCRHVAGSIRVGANEIAEVRGGSFRDVGGGSTSGILGADDFATPTLIVEGARFAITHPTRNRFIQPHTYTARISAVIAPTVFDLGTRAEFDLTLLPRLAAVIGAFVSLLTESSRTKETLGKGKSEKDRSGAVTFISSRLHSYSPSPRPHLLSNRAHRIWRSGVGGWTGGPAEIDLSRVRS